MHFVDSYESNILINFDKLDIFKTDDIIKNHRKLLILFYSKKNANKLKEYC